MSDGDERDESSAKDEGSREDEATAQAQQPAGSAGVLYNAHDVKRLEAECSKITQTLLEMGADPGRLAQLVQAQKQAATIFALGRLMMLKGLVTEDELQGEELARLKDMLLADLHQAEQSKLASQGPQVQPVRKPGLIVARR